LSKMLPESVNIIWISDGLVMTNDKDKSKDKDKNKKYLLYIHGGGYAFGGASHVGYLCHVSKAFNGVDIILIDYTKAPQKHLPFQMYEIFTAYLYVLFNLNSKAENVVIMGDSAGGGLGLLFTQFLSQLNTNNNNKILIPPPKGLVMTSPWLDLSMSGDTWRTQKQNDIFVRELFAERCAKLVSNEHNANLRKNSKFSPLFGQFQGLPTHIYVVVSSSECLHSESVALVEKLQTVGRDWQFQQRYDQHKEKNTTNELWFVEKKFMPHTWINFVGVFPEAETTLNDLARVVNTWFL